MGHSRGGHIAFRVAQQRPELLRRLVLAEPVGDLDASLLPPDAPPPVHTVGTGYKVTAERVATGDIDGALTLFAENYDGPGAWERVPPPVRQTWRDNARTLIGQANERRQPFTRADAEAISVPTLIIIGADTPGSLPSMSRALAAHVRGSRVEVIPQRQALHVRGGSGAVLRGGHGVPGGIGAKWGASVARCPPNRAYRLCSDSERLIVIGTCHMAR